MSDHAKVSIWQNRADLGLFAVPSTLLIMSRRRVGLLALVAVLAGVALLVYVLRAVSPYSADARLNGLALLLFFTALVVSMAGIGTLAALLLHRRWPALAGRVNTRSRRKQTPLTAAIRQGALFGLTMAVIVALSMLRLLDAAVLLVTLVVAGLIEAFAQSRQ